MLRHFHNQAFGWREIHDWSVGYITGVWLVIFLIAMGFGYMIYFKQFHRRYQLTQQQFQQHRQQWVQATKWIQQADPSRQEDQPPYSPLIPVNDTNVAAVVAQVTQLSEQYATAILQLRQQHNVPESWSMIIEVQTDFASFLQWLQGLNQLPYALQITQITLMRNPSMIDSKRLRGKMVLKTYAYE